MLIGRGRGIAVGLAVVAAAALALYLLVLDGGDSGDEGAALAQLGDAEVTEAEFEDALLVAIAGRFTPGAEVAPAFPGAVDFAGCRLGADDIGRGSSPVESLERRCSKQAASIQEQVRSLLVTQLWYERQAQEDDIEVSDSEIEERLQAIEGSFEKPADFERLAKNAGEGDDALHPWVRAQLLQEAVRESASDDPGKVSDEEISDYYRENRKAFPGQSLEKAREAIRAAILGVREAEAFAALQQELERQWKPETECAPEFNVIACGKVSGQADGGGDDGGGDGAFGGAGSEGGKGGK